jgi:isopentenyl-diphosphate Delta-isomerase
MDFRIAFILIFITNLQYIYVPKCLVDSKLYGFKESLTVVLGALLLSLKFFRIFERLIKAMVEEKVILVNEYDEPIGLMNKLEAHEKAVLHRAFSVFVLNSNNEIMLQQRAHQKYHSPLLWTNTCCSHQRDGETNIQAGTRRLNEEMGFKTELKELFHFIYKAPFDNGLTEHELDHVMIGYYNDVPNINEEEVESWKWMCIEEVRKDMIQNPTIYTVWFKIIFAEFYHYLEDHKL